VTPLLCIECGCTAVEEARGWRAYVIDLDDDGEDEIVCYCPTCSAREFDFGESA